MIRNINGMKLVRNKLNLEYQRIVDTDIHEYSYL